MHANYHSAEELAWLKLDLELNQDKTVILVSHNALPDTTAHQTSPVYRQVANSEAIFDLMRQYSNIRAWIHGHNHVYDVDVLEIKAVVGSCTQAACLYDRIFRVGLMGKVNRLMVSRHVVERDLGRGSGEVG